MTAMSSYLSLQFNDIHIFSCKIAFVKQFHTFHRWWNNLMCCYFDFNCYLRLWFAFDIIIMLKKHLQKNIFKRCVTTNYTVTKHFHFLLPYLSLLELTMEEEFQGEPTLGGHNFVFIDELSPGQACPICLLAMRRPVQTVCGHRFCHSCLLESFRCCVICTVCIIQLSCCILYFVYFSAWRYECSKRKVERAKCS